LSKRLLDADMASDSSFLFYQAVLAGPFRIIIYARIRIFVRQDFKYFIWIHLPVFVIEHLQEFLKIVPYNSCVARRFKFYYYLRILL
jgi:hypothetical protein